jgi:fumarate reductase subunit D
MKTKLLAASLIGLQLLPVLVLAQITPLPPAPPGARSIGGLTNILRFVVDIIFTVLMILAIIFILFAAFYYLTAMGDPTKVGKAHNMLIYAAVAIAVALIAQGVEFVVRTVIERTG